MTPNQIQINDEWDALEQLFPEKSVPWLMQMICDRVPFECDHGDVATALGERQKHDTKDT